ncbi:hypothetical protein EXN66_Car013892 [Channa argus]|uniref:Immunoglobulin V-set domain-containing protein n=1 Tax=Channa argus TaxID=215402 RepID=A0A6G1Q6G4_CHAAH|nr:hypothetical protein EXN66_Car013892 [Channa argus]
MKDGDVSLFLKNVTINDTGTFQCNVGNKGSKPQLISTITMTVPQPGDGGDKDEGNTDVVEENDGGENGGKTDGSRQYIGLIAGLLVAIVLIFVLVFIKKSHLLSDDEACEKHPV